MGMSGQRPFLWHGKWHVTNNAYFHGTEMGMSRTTSVSHGILSQYEFNSFHPHFGSYLWAFYWSLPFIEIDPATMTEEQREIRRHALNWQTNSLQNAFQQHELGLLPEDVWQQVQGRIQNRWASCYTRETYSQVIPSFREYLETLPVECVSN